ncbi:cyclic nucleotide-binding domain protein [Pseudoramibacter alactolyticus ATCC 23263]|uniref:Cyclic nucleotide-binding domain protein n=1 Tax=Pseudoramibacter alactolyticus ATCC 23263 TaxID=887929 RepID=E6MEJ1_9FIRM|nr:Crp/Fnr family transcriptional regulator [Pseudoramibacter alactolyticus]EFV02516.1 cyclic nucleotide-binding domain protein [Pseudoramibacter alactolyticus ATCC 23263]
MDIDFLSQTKLFHGIAPDAIPKVLSNLGYRIKNYDREAVIYMAGDSADAIGLVLSGSVRIENNDFWGNTSVLANIAPGSVFAETYALLSGEPLMVDVIAQKKSTVLFLQTEHLFDFSHDTSIANRRHTIIHNLLMISIQKNLHLSRRIFHTSSKSIRGRLISYLSFVAQKKNTNDFVIPFNRQHLADYLSVDRSALSHELSKMQDEGLLITEKSHFVLNFDL